MARFYWDHDDSSDRDAPLRFAYQTPGLVQTLGLRIEGADHEYVMNTMLTEMCLAAETDQALSYSRRMEFYRRSRYRPLAFGYTMMMRVIDQIVDAGLGTENRTLPGVRGRQSTIRAAADLYDAWLGMGQDPLYDANGETVVIKTRKTKHSPAELIEYVDTLKHIGLRKALQSVNEMTAATVIGGIGAHEVRPNVLRFERQALDRYGREITRIQHVRMVPGNGGRRLFCENLNQHGRYYFWPQNIPGEARAGITINGEPATEIDYSGHHLRLAYSLTGRTIDGDEYDVGGGFQRKHVKAGTLIALNARGFKSAVGALVQDQGIPRRLSARVMEAIERRHQPIARTLFSDFGIKAMRTDSDIMLGVTADLAAVGIRSIPIHDSTIVQAKFASEAKAAMEKNWYKFAGSVNTCKVR